MHIHITALFNIYYALIFYIHILYRKWKNTENLKKLRNKTSKNIFVIYHKVTYVPSFFTFCVLYFTISSKSYWKNQALCYYIIYLRQRLYCVVTLKKEKSAKIARNSCWTMHTLLELPTDAWFFPVTFSF